MMKRQLVVIWALVALGATAGAGLAANVTGKVSDGETGEPVSFVTVQVLGTSPAGQSVALGNMTLPDGTYFIAGIPLGRYKVRFTRIGYDTVEDSIRVTDTEATYTVNRVLGVAPVEVPEIIVEGDRYAGIKDIQPGFIALDSDGLSDIPGVIENDPIRSLTLVPGISAASDFSSGLYVRGGGPDQTLVLLDQVPVYNPTHAFGFFSSFNGDAIDDVNLYKGAYPADYAGRLGAVLDVRSRDGNPEGVHGRVGISTIAARATLDGPVGEGNWMISGRRTYLDPVLDALRSDDNEIPDYKFYDLNGKLSLPLAGGRATFSAYRGRDDLALDFDADSQIAFEWGNTLASAGWSRPLSESVFFKLLVSGSEYQSQSELRALTTPFEFSNFIRDFTGRADLTWRAGLAHTVTAGLQASQFDVEYEQVFNSDPQVEYRRTPTEMALYLEDEWTPRRGSVLQAGLRTRYIDDGSLLLWEPRVAASQRVGERWRLKLGGGVYNQYMQLVATEGFSAADFYVPIDPSTQPGRSLQAVLGAEFFPTPTYFFSIEGYYTDLSRLVTFNNTTPDDAGVTRATDIFYTDGEGWASGMELFLEKRRGSVTGWIGYTLGWTRRRWDELNAGAYFPPKYDRRHDLSVVAQYRRGKWRFGSAFVYATGQAFTPAASRYVVVNPATGEVPSTPLLLPAEKNSARLLAYHRLDVTVSRDFSMFGLPSEVFLQVFNLYNRENEWFVQYNDEGAVVVPEVVGMLPLIPSLGIRTRF